MNILIRKAVIFEPGSSLNGKSKDILIVNGAIARIADHIDDQADQVIAQPGLCTSPGWVDVFAHFCDPGYEFKETLQSGANAAAAGGYTHVLILPNTNPVIHNKLSSRV